MAHVTLREPAGWSDLMLDRLDVALDRVELSLRALFADRHGDFQAAAHAARLRRMAARGGGGQALI